MNRVTGSMADGQFRAKIRLDFRGMSRRGRFLFGTKPTDKVAEEIREQHVALLRNVPVQGIQIEDIDMGGQIYTVYDESINAEVAYAPVELTIVSDALESVLRFISREEFRRIEIIAPPNLTLSRFEIERMFFKVHEEIRQVREWVERKYSR